MIRLTLPWPPSTNKTWRGKKGRSKPYLSAKSTTYRLAVRSLVLGAKLPGLPVHGALEVKVILCPPDKRRRDEDNFAGKALFDALTKAGVWLDDSQIRRKVVEWGDVARGGCVAVEILPIPQTVGA